jgi:UPF0271 protein
MNKKILIDLNCDMGESYGNYSIGDDTSIMPYITSCNIACGFHGGDPYHIEKTIDRAISYGLNIGAHPSYPDLVGFGRRYMSIVPKELKSVVKYQVATIKGLVESKGGRLTHVKPHGALYNQMARDRDEALTVMEAIAELDDTLKVMLLAHSEAEAVAEELKVPFIREAFIDRRYDSPTSLVSRNIKDGVIENPESAVKQFFDLSLNNQAVSLTGEIFRIVPHSICIHGDNPSAADILKKLHQELKTQAMVELMPFKR